MARIATDDLAGQRDRADLFRCQTLQKRAELDKHKLCDPSVTDFHDLSASAKKGPRSLPQRTIDGPRVPKSSYDRLLKDCRLLAPEEGKSVGFVEYLKSCFNISAPRKLDFALWGLA
jgi:hypothetical protein